MGEINSKPVYASSPTFHNPIIVINGKNEYMTIKLHLERDRCVTIIKNQHLIFEFMKTASTYDIWKYIEPTVIKYFETNDELVISDNILNIGEKKKFKRIDQVEDCMLDLLSILVKTKSTYY